jgi:hypothetical protein
MFNAMVSGTALAYILGVRGPMARKRSVDCNGNKDNFRKEHDNEEADLETDVVEKGTGKKVREKDGDTADKSECQFAQGL